MHAQPHPHRRYAQAKMEAAERAERAESLITAEQYFNNEYDERLHDRRTELIHGRVLLNAPALPH